MKRRFCLFSSKIHCFYYFYRTPNAIKEFPVVVHDFYCDLIELKAALHRRNMDEINSIAYKLLQMADDIHEVVTAYMDFVHPIYLDIQRYGIFNEGRMALLKSELNAKLVEKKNSFERICCFDHPKTNRRMNDAFTYQCSLCLFTFMILLKNTFMILLKNTFMIILKKWGN